MIFSEQHVKNLLTNEGLFLNIGLFSFNIKSPVESLAYSLSTLYSDYPEGLSDNHSAFVDFHISVDATTLWHKYINHQVQFLFDGFAPFSPLPVQHAPAIIEWGMNWCISNHINTHLIVHAAVIEKSGYAAIMPAPPGAGKSTLTAALIQEGWRLLSDELTLIRLDNAQISPVPRPVSLKNESINVIKSRYPEVIFGPLSTDTSKGTVGHIKPPKLSVINQEIECPVGWIIFPKFEKDAQAELQKTGKAKTLMDVADNSFNYSRLGASGFEALKTIVDTADCYQFRYSLLDDAIDIFNSLKVPK